jgi:NAD(P)-dependent dehydrogenase (short-subunit alcohol dehydrogenase family)
LPDPEWPKSAVIRKGAMPPSSSDTAENLLGLVPPVGSRILVAGGCGGIGRPMVKACLSIGLEVSVLAMPSSIERNPPPDGVLAIAADATDDASVANAFAELGREWDSIDVLVFLVGFMIVPPTPIPDVSPKAWDEVMMGNLRSAFLVCRQALPFLHKAGGAIVNVGSSLAYNPLKGVSAYASAKGGLVSLTKSLAIENAPGIRANLIAPSAIETSFLAGGDGQRGKVAARKGGDSWFHTMREQYLPTIPLERIAQPEDIIGPTLFLASPAASFITGQVLHVNGGRVTP